MTGISILSTDKKEKKGIVSERLIADVAILDGELCTCLNRITSASSSLDAIVHSLEAYTSR